MYIIRYRKMTASVFEDPQTTELHGFSWIFSITYYHHVPFFNCLATLFINHIHPVISRFSLVFFGPTHSINRFLNASEEQPIFFRPDEDALEERAQATPGAPRWGDGDVEVMEVIEMYLVGGFNLPL